MPTTQPDMHPVRFTPEQHEHAVACILDIIDGTLAGMERNPRKWGSFINPRLFLRIWTRYCPRVARATPSDIATIQASLDSLYVRHMKPHGAADDGCDTALKTAEFRSPAVSDWTWWGAVDAEHNEMHVAKLMEFRAIVAAGDIDPAPYL